MKKNLLLLSFLLFSLPKLWAETVTVIICPGEAHIWNGCTYTESGIYTSGADVLYLTVLPENPIIHEYATICSGEVYEWYGGKYWESGEYSITLSDDFGCEQITILHLTVNQCEEGQVDYVTICAGETYSWHGKTYNVTTTDIYGADTLYLTVLPKAIVEDSITIHEKDLPYTWHNQKIDTSGVYTDTILYSQTECDSAIYVLNVEVIPDNTCGPSLIWCHIHPCTLEIAGRGNMYDYFTVIVPWKDIIKNICTIVLPEELSSIGAFAFDDCYYLSSFDVPSSVVRINDGAFENCRSLSSVNFANNGQLTTIGSWAFYNCHELKDVVIPEGVTEIGHAAFYGCTYLKDLTLPTSLQSIADNGFAGCSKLAQIQVNAIIPPQVDARTFEDVDRSIPVIVPDESVEQYKSAPVWKEFNVRGKIGTGVENITSTTNNVQKIIRDNQLFIIRDGKMYGIMGQEIK